MIFPVVLAGGAGTRLWPLSRKSYPKQFQPLLGGQNSLFQQTVERVRGPGYADPVIVTGEAFRFIVGDQLGQIGARSHLTLVEPEGRNSAPAILAAAIALQQSSPDALMLIVPSDHLIPDASLFRAAVAAASPSAEAGRIVTFGINPTRP